MPTSKRRKRASSACVGECGPPVGSTVGADAGTESGVKRCQIACPMWHPTRLNQLLGCHWRAAKLKKADRYAIRVYAMIADVPKATGKRRVTLTIGLGPKQRAGDPDAYWKSLLDAMKHAGLLVDDNRQHCELAPVVFERWPTKGTVITLEDLE